MVVRLMLKLLPHEMKVHPDLLVLREEADPVVVVETSMVVAHAKVLHREKMNHQTLVNVVPVDIVDEVGIMVIEIMPPEALLRDTIKVLLAPTKIMKASALPHVEETIIIAEDLLPELHEPKM